MVFTPYAPVLSTSAVRIRRRERVVQHCCQRFINKRRDVVVRAAEVSRMLRIRGEPLEAVHHELAQGAHVLVFGGEHADRLRLFEHLCRAGDGEVRGVLVLRLAGT